MPLQICIFCCKAMALQNIRKRYIAKGNRPNLHAGLA